MHVWRLKIEMTETLRTFLSNCEFTFSCKPHQIFHAKKDKLSINFYKTGKLVFNSAPSATYLNLLKFLESSATAVSTVQKETVEHSFAEWPDASETRIGTDESGKGDYFGPLVICGVKADRFQLEDLVAAGVGDSKKFDDRRIKTMAKEIRGIIPLKDRSVIVLSPEKYNQMHSKMKNVNVMLGWGHATVIENILLNGNVCALAISDKFGNSRYIEQSLKEHGKKIRLIQVTHGERDRAVAAASILAREKFVYEMDTLSEKYGLKLPKGATHVIPTAVNFARKHGGDELRHIAKIHFSTTQKVLSLLKKS